MKIKDTIFLTIALGALLVMLWLIATTHDTSSPIFHWSVGGIIGLAVLVTAWVLTRLRFNRSR